MYRWCALECWLGVGGEGVTRLGELFVVCVCVCVCVYAKALVYTQMCVYVCVCVNTDIYTHTLTLLLSASSQTPDQYVCMQKHWFIHTYMCVCVRERESTNIYMHTLTCSSVHLVKLLISVRGEGPTLASFFSATAPVPVFVLVTALMRVRGDQSVMPPAVRKELFLLMAGEALLF